MGFKPDDLSGILENAIYNHLRIHGYDVKTGQLMKGLEVDFIAEKNGEKKYIQVATTIIKEETRKREFGNLNKIRYNYQRMVVTLNDTFPKSWNGIETCSLSEFLMK